MPRSMPPPSPKPLFWMPWAICCCAAMLPAVCETPSYAETFILFEANWRTSWRDSSSNSMLSMPTPDTSNPKRFLHVPAFVSSLRTRVAISFAWAGSCEIRY